jgi:hypothetical protein
MKKLVRACTPECLPSPKRFVQAGVSARLRAETLQRAGTQAWNVPRTREIKTLSA